MKLQNG